MNFKTLLKNPLNRERNKTLEIKLNEIEAAILKDFQAVRTKWEKWGVVSTIMLPAALTKFSREIERAPLDTPLELTISKGEPTIQEWAILEKEKARIAWLARQEEIDAATLTNTPVMQQYSQENIKPNKEAKALSSRIF